MELMAHRLPAPERTPLPPAEITARTGRKLGLWCGSGPVATHAAHFGFGAATGALFGALGGRRPAQGIAYGLGVWGVSYLGWVPALSLMAPATRHPGRRNALMIAAHVVWGATLAALVGRITEDRRRRPPVAAATLP
jgi:hypothetical protein